MAQGIDIHPTAVEISKGIGNEILIIFTDRHGKSVAHLNSKMAADLSNKIWRATGKGERGK